MIQNIKISGLRVEINDDIEKYIVRKIGSLDRYLARHSRESVHAEIWLKEENTNDKNNRTCEVVLHLPHDVIKVKETTVNIYAAIDIAEAKLKNKLVKYKSEHVHSKIHQKLRKRLDDRRI